MRRLESTPAIINSRNPRLIKLNAIPQLTRHRTMRLVQRFAVVRIRAASHFSAATAFHFNKPIRVCKRLPRHADDVSVSFTQNRFSLFKG